MRKHERGICCFFGCKQQATIRLKTPGYNQRDNEEQLFCQHHWEGNLTLHTPPLHEIDQSRVSQIEQEETH